MTDRRSDVVEVTTRINAPREAVFEFLVDADQYPRWQGVTADLDAQAGGVYRMSMANGATARGVYLVVEPPRRVVFSWGWDGDADLPPGSSTIEITLTAVGDETLLHLRHTGLPSAEARRQHAAGWRNHLARLAAIAQDRQSADPLRSG